MRHAPQTRNNPILGFDDDMKMQPGTIIFYLYLKTDRTHPVTGSFVRIVRITRARRNDHKIFWSDVFADVAVVIALKGLGHAILGNFV